MEKGTGDEVNETTPAYCYTGVKVYNPATATSHLLSSLHVERGRSVIIQFSMDKHSEHNDGTKIRPNIWLSKPELWFKLKDIAREYRHEMTDAEKALWAKLRNKGLGVKFRRQHAIERFIVDFVCLDKKLVIEVDGDVHRKTVERDEIRDEFLTGLGFTVLHFWNDEVLNSLEVVLDRINKTLESL